MSLRLAWTRKSVTASMNLLSEIGEQIIVILSTHLVEDVRNLCTRMGIMKNGKLIATGRPEAFVAALEGKIWSGRIRKKTCLNTRRITRCSLLILMQENFISVFTRKPGRVGIPDQYCGS